MTHPLTDEMCKQIKLHIFNRGEIKGRAEMLEQVIEQWEEVINTNKTKTDIQIIWEFDKRLKAMRPQEDTP